MSLKCSICNRPVNKGARRVPLLGPVGPECHTQVSGLAAFIDHFNLTGFEAGPVVVPAVLGTDGEGRDTWLVPRPLLEARARAFRAGLVLVLADAGSKDERPLISATLKIPGIVGAKAGFLTRVAGWAEAVAA